MWIGVMSGLPVLVWVRLLAVIRACTRDCHHLFMNMLNLSFHGIPELQRKENGKINIINREIRRHQ